MSDPASITSAPPRRLRRVEASRYLKEQHGLDYKPNTLAKLFTIGGGPLVRKSGRVPLYEVASLDLWAESQLSPPVRSSSELATFAAPAGA
jgi:hypothetical protein